MMPNRNKGLGRPQNGAGLHTTSLIGDGRRGNLGVLIPTILPIAAESNVVS